jgi:hypothetical protein
MKSERVTIRYAGIESLLIFAMWRLSLGFNVGRRALASCGNRTELLSSSAPLNSAADCAPFPIAQIPAVTDAEDLPVLLATPH